MSSARTMPMRRARSALQLYNTSTTLSLRRTKSAHEFYESSKRSNEHRSPPERSHSSSTLERLMIMRHNVAHDEGALEDLVIENMESVIDGNVVQHRREEKIAFPMIHGIQSENEDELLRVRKGNYAANEKEVASNVNGNNGATTEANYEKSTPKAKGYKLSIAKGNEESLPPREQHGYHLLSLRLLAVLGGVVVGYATSFLGPIFDMPNFVKKMDPSLVPKQTFSTGRNYCAFSDPSFLAISSIISPFSAFGLCLAFLLMRKTGRRPLLFMGSLNEIIGIALVLWFPSALIAIFGLACIGCGVGLHCLAIPTLCSELAPKELGRHFGALFGFQVLGGALASLVNLGASFQLVWGWRVPFGVLGFLVVVLMLVSIQIDESPMYYVEINEEKRGLEVLIKMRPNQFVADTRMEWENILRDVREIQNTSQVKELLSRSTRPTISIMLAGVFLPQVITTAPMLFFGPVTVGSLSTLKNQQFCVAAIAGVLGFSFTFSTSLFLQKFKRRRPYIISFISIAVSQFILGVVFVYFTSAEANMKKGHAYVASTMIVIAFVGVTVLMSPHGWINTPLGRDGKLGGACVVGFGFLVTFSKNMYSVMLLCKIGGWTFFVDFGVTVVSCLIFYKFVPETTGVKSDGVVNIWSEHPFWRRFLEDGVAQSRVELSTVG